MTVQVSDEVRQLRAAVAARTPDAVPCGASRLQPFRSQLRATLVKHEGQDFVRIEGYASVVERGYEMWDMFGPYTEVVSTGAFDKTLDANPDVAFLVNHRGVTMARTTSPGRLVLSADDQGLRSVALVNPKRQDVNDLVHAIEDGDITEMSFAFEIVSGRWSPDYMEYRIDEVNLDRGDVSAVNYGANPYTSIAARSAEILRDLEHIPAGAARAAVERLSARTDIDVAEQVGVAQQDATEALVSAAVERALAQRGLHPRPAGLDAPEGEQRNGRSVALLRRQLDLLEDE